jgi:tetratricopeptide (TPR) repeat protein
MAKSFFESILGGLFGGLGSEAVEGVAGTLADAALNSMLGQTLDEAKGYASAYIATPLNHDLERSLRFAALLACLHLIRQQAKIEEADQASHRAAIPDQFCPAARDWLNGQFLALGQVQEGAHDTIITQYQQALDTALASRPDARDATRAQEARAIAEQAMWGELTAALASHAMPEDFKTRFMGNGQLGWFSLFIIFVREGLKNQDNARHAFFIGGLSDSKNALARIEEELRRLGIRIGEPPVTQGPKFPKGPVVINVAILVTLLAIILPPMIGNRKPVVISAEPVVINYGTDDATARERHTELLAAISREKGVAIAPLRAVLRRLGELNVAPEDIPARLDAAATRLLELEKTLAQPIQGDAAAQAARDAARRLIDLGDFDAAAALLRQGRQDARKRREDSQRIEAAMAADEAGLARVDLRYRDAAALYAEAAELVPFDAGAAWGYRLDQGKVLYDLGKEFGDNAALREAISVYEQALALASRNRVPLDWAMTQNNLGNALLYLGESKGDTALLEEAVTVYHASLEERTRDRVPLDWAMTRNNLGNALQTLGALERGTARLEEAVTAYREALEELTRDRVPLDWAKTQNNLGAALLILGDRKGDPSLLEEAVTAYRKALKERTRDRVPREWAATQSNLGTALEHLGARKGDTSLLEKAVIAFREALEEYSRDRVPLDWAATQNNLGAALLTLGQHERGTTRLEKAVTAFRAALEERTRDRVPLDWAMTQNNLGYALTRLGEHKNDTVLLEEAVTAYRAALEERTRERVPLDWAATKNNLGHALGRLGVRKGDTSLLEQAVTAYHEALEEYTRDRVPVYWAGTQNNLGNALSDLGKRERGTLRLEDAVTAYREALEERTRERLPLDWAATQYNLGIALSDLGERKRDTSLLEEAVSAYREALEEYTRDRVPRHWAATQNNLGNALSSLGARKGDTWLLEQALAAFREALEEYTRDRVPLYWAYSQHNLGNCLAELANLSATPEAHLAAAITHMQNAVEGFREVGDGHWTPIAEKRLAELKAQQK